MEDSDLYGGYCDPQSGTKKIYFAAPVHLERLNQRNRDRLQSYAGETALQPTEVETDLEDPIQE